MDTKLGKKINEGVSAEIFEWENNEKIIKLAKSRSYSQAMVTEYLNSQVAWESGLSVPQPFKMVEIYNRIGIVFERIYGDTLMDHFFNQSLCSFNTEGNIRGMNYKDVPRITAKILRETHSRRSAKNMPFQRRAIICSIDGAKHLTPSEKKLVLDVLNSIPIKQQLCHGDPNLNNILIRDRDNKALLIDWMYASIGNPEADLAEYIITVKYGKSFKNIPDGIIDYIDPIREETIKAFIDEYTKLSDITYEDIDAWIMPMAASRLSAGIIKYDEQKLLVGEVRKRLRKYN